MTGYSLAILTLSYCLSQGAAEPKSAATLMLEAGLAAKAGDVEKAVALCGKAIALEPKRVSFVLERGVYLERLGKNQEAAADFTRAIELDPKEAEPYHFRGCVQFKLGKFQESVKDFDKYIEMVPERKASHWQRGICYYYAGRFDEGKAQFEGYQKFDSNDVENAVWRFLCQARKEGVDKARKDMLKIGNDQRVPMKEVYELFLGKLKPDDVLTVARNQKQSPPFFYAHLYLGLYHDALGDRKKALEHLNIATENYRVQHYMWDVARVHRDLLKKDENK